MAGPLVVSLSIKRRWFFNPLFYVLGRLAKAGLITVQTAANIAFKGMKVHVG